MSTPQVPRPPRPAVAELLGLDAFALDERSHIEVDTAICDTCPTRPCLAACPAQLYRLGPDGGVTFDHAGCLECGTCQAVCEHGGVTSWRLPRATFGVSYRYG
jgi:ferredoxin like protein